MVVLLYDIIPSTDVVPSKVNGVSELQETRLMLSLKVTEIAWLRGTPEAPFAVVGDYTTGQATTNSSKLSFLHPAIRTANENDRMMTDFFMV